jgi:hypothetical protein
MAQGHGVEPKSFFTHLCGRFRLPSDRNLDTIPSYELLAEVSRRTAVHYDRLVMMTISWHVEPWYAREARNDRRGSFGFCSLCWKTDPIPYVRRAWRLSWMACQKHRIPLRWWCPECRRETSIEALGPLQPISRCVQCDFDLAGAAPLGWPHSRTPEEIADLLDRWRQEFERATSRYRIA